MAPLQVRREELLAQLMQNSRTVRPAIRGSFSGEVLSSAEFAEAEYPREWLVEEFMVVGEPAIWGGEKKSLKTSIAIDLAVSLGASSTESRFLDRFDVPRRKRVLMLSGESGAATIQETVRRICHQRSISMSDLSVDWGFTLPRFTSSDDLEALARVIRDKGEQVVIIDPLYLCLLAGNTDLQAQNLFHIGPLLRDVSQACLGAGATPVLLHHAVKTRNPKHTHQPLDLGELSFAAMGEFARQWVLLSRRAVFDPEDPMGQHRLWMSVGGSAGIHGLWGVDVMEGQLRRDFGGRRWDVTVMSAESARQQGAEAAQCRRERRVDGQAAHDDAQILEILARHPDGEVQTTLAREARFSHGKARTVLARLVASRRIEQCNFIRDNSVRTFSGYRLSHGIDEAHNISSNDG